MRLWSFHPQYLDSIGLVACWREALLARKVLQGQTKGYNNHPQLLRFKAYTKPLEAIEAYLCTIFDESKYRGYNFDSSKLIATIIRPIITVTQGQLDYEFEHLKNKLIIRNPNIYLKLLNSITIAQNPIFNVIDGSIEPWEVLKNENNH